MHRHNVGGLSINKYCNLIAMILLFVLPSIFLLKAGSLKRDEYGNISDARSSVTLVISGSRTIIIDSGFKGEAELLIDALASRGLEPSDIEMIVNTHAHPDHTGNNFLFDNADFLNPHEGEAIAPHVTVMETPGHSLDSISVLVDAEKIVVIAGDALPTLSNFLKNVPPALHIDRDLSISSMHRIINSAEIVIPGHDHPFSIPDRRYIKWSNRS
jgi:N-acyl homoserine lactone hydrolase